MQNHRCQRREKGAAHRPGRPGTCLPAVRGAERQPTPGDHGISVKPHHQGRTAAGGGKLPAPSQGSGPHPVQQPAVRPGKEPCQRRLQGNQASGAHGTIPGSV